MWDLMGFGALGKVDRWGEHRLGIATLVIAGIVGVVASGDPYLIRLLTLSCIYAALGLGLRMTFGELGELDLGYLALYAMGGYSFGLVRIHWDFGPLPAVLCAILFVAVVSLLVSLLTLRLSGPFFAVTTLGVLVVATSLVVSSTDLTGGINGLHGFGGGAGSPVPYTSWSGGRAWFLLAFVVLCLVVAFTYWMQSSRFGDAVNAIRQDPVLFRSLGYNVTIFRAAAAAIGGAIAGLAGSTFALYSGFISVDLLSLHLLGVLLLIVKLGGPRSPAGVVIGAFVITLLPEYLRFVGEHRLIGFGAVLVLSVRIFQTGFGPQLGHLVARLRRGGDAARSVPAEPDPPERPDTPDSTVTSPIGGAT
jgi:ABC-type branched-subunit amino acid transport system permease subunit